MAPHNIDTYLTMREPIAARKILRGFSLIEVVIALGIGSFALVAMLGVIPVGLQSIRDSVFVTSQAAITESLVANAQRTPWDKLDAWNGALRYFSVEGRPLTTSNSAAVFAVTTRLVKTVPAASTGLPHQQLARLTVEIRSLNSQQTAKISALVGNNGSPL